MHRRTLWLTALALVAVGVGGYALTRLGARNRTAATLIPLMTVWKSPTCGCCTDWVAHVRRAGFRLEVHDVHDVESEKRRLGVPQALGSCHTATIAGYVIEGHVPADVIQRLLAERPAVTGLAVPGMPIGSPGMEMAGARPQPYDIVTFDRQGQTAVYARR
jgi:hypothetical protein